MKSAGEWFRCEGYWLVPSGKGNGRTLRPRTRKLARVGKPGVRSPRKSARVTEKQIERQLQDYFESETARYNAQPEWSLRNLRARSLDEARAIIAEFQRCVRHTSAEFSWPSTYPSKRMHWRKHGWKHITFDAIVSVAEDARAARGHFRYLRLDLLGGSDEDHRKVFLDAAGRDPAAVARLDHLLPTEGSKMDVARLLFDRDTAQRIVDSIPSASELGGEYADVAVRCPDPKEADEAREHLKQLVSPGAARGSTGQGGRPPVPYDDETIDLVYKMSYSLCRQIKEVDRFIARFMRRGETRRAYLAVLYPVIEKLSIPPPGSFLKLRAMAGGALIAAHVLGLSSSKVRKVVYRRHS